MNKKLSVELESEPEIEFEVEHTRIDPRTGRAYGVGRAVTIKIDRNHVHLINDSHLTSDEKEELKYLRNTCERLRKEQNAWRERISFLTEENSKLTQQILELRVKGSWMLDYFNTQTESFRKAFFSIALKAFHPDKCKHPNANDFFIFLNELRDRLK